MILTNKLVKMKMNRYETSYNLNCYDLNSVLSKRHTLVLSNTRELDRVPKYKHLPYIQTTDSLCYNSLALP